MSEKTFALDDRYTGPVKLIDRQHRDLIKNLNRAARQTAGAKLPDFEKVITDLIQQLREHFVDEEAIMVEAKFPNLDWHKTHHAQSLHQAEETLKRCIARGYADDLDLARLFESVLLDIAKADLQFYAYLEQSGQIAKFRDRL